MKFSLIRLSPGQSNVRIPHRQHVGERSKRQRAGTNIATYGGRVSNRAPGTASPLLPRSHRTPGYRPFAPAVSALPPFITTTACSDFRSALHHFTAKLLIGLAFTGRRSTANHDHVLPVPRRISPVPRRTVQPFRSPYPGGDSAATSKVFALSMAFAQRRKARHPHRCHDEAAGFLVVRTGDAGSPILRQDRQSKSAPLAAPLIASASPPRLKRSITTSSEEGRRCGAHWSGRR